MSTVIYPRSASNVAIKTRMALGAFTAVPRVTEAARSLDSWLSDMATYAFAGTQQDAGPEWALVARELVCAIQAVKATSSATSSAGIHAAITGATNAITHFEATAGISAPGGIDDAPTATNSHTSA